LLIGIDIVDIARIKNVAFRTPRFLRRVFTEQELDYCYQKKDPYPSLAARFATREAVRKLDAVFIKGFRFHDIEVWADANSKPHLLLHNAALKLARESKIIEWSLSISHSQEQAIAVVIAKKG
jgi:holo-[acyl-carrier protein] synthase